MAEAKQAPDSTAADEHERQELAAVNNALGAAWQRVLDVAQWALREYRKADIQAEPVCTAWVTMRYIFGSTRFKTHFLQVAAGYTLMDCSYAWQEYIGSTNAIGGYHATHHESRFLMITTEGHLVYVDDVRPVNSQGVVTGDRATKCITPELRTAATAGPIRARSDARKLDQVLITNFGQLTEELPSAAYIDNFTDTVLLHVADNIRQLSA